MWQYLAWPDPRTAAHTCRLMRVSGHFHEMPHASGTVWRVELNSWFKDNTHDSDPVDKTDVVVRGRKDSSDQPNTGRSGTLIHPAHERYSQGPNNLRQNVACVGGRNPEHCMPKPTLLLHRILLYRGKRNKSHNWAPGWPASGCRNRSVDVSPRPPPLHQPPWVPTRMKRPLISSVL